MAMNDTCKEQEPSICEYRGESLLLISIQQIQYLASAIHYSKYLILACMSKSGQQCIFPFKYRTKDASGVFVNLTYKACSSADIFTPWCPTSNKQIIIVSKDSNLIHISLQQNTTQSLRKSWNGTIV